MGLTIAGALSVVLLAYCWYLAFKAETKRREDEEWHYARRR